MAIKAPYYPIVYVRGFAATMAEIEETVATPYDKGNSYCHNDYRDAYQS